MEENDAQPRSSRLRDIGVAVVVGLVVIGIVFALNWEGGDESGGSSPVSVRPMGPAPQVGKAAADFGVMTLEGTPIRLSELKGRPVWLNFWATWCPPCRAEMPDINAVYDEEKDKDLVILAVSMGEDAETVRRYVEKAAMPFTIGLDGNQFVTALYRISGIPTHVFIDRDGIIRDIQVGGMSKALMKRKISRIM